MRVHDTSEPSDDGRRRSRRGRRTVQFAMAFALGCASGSSVAWAVSDGDGSSSALGDQPATVASAGAQPNYYPHGFDYGAVSTGSARGATPTSADAAERRALSEQHARCRTFASADAIERCMTHLPR